MGRAADNWQEPGAVLLRGVTKSYQRRTVLDDISLDVQRGEFLAIIGPSGSGKTTMMRIIGGFETPDQGQVVIAGEDVTALPPERRRVNTVFQSYALFPHLSVLDNVAFGPRMRGLSRKAGNDQALAMLDLVRLSDAAERSPAELSGGMQQRVALARALANNPAVLLLDEPLGALDRKLRIEMQRELRRVRAALGSTFIYVTHDQEEAFGMADRIVILKSGRIEQIGSPAEVYDAPATAWVAKFIGSVNALPGLLAASGRQLEGCFGTVEAEHIETGLRPQAAAVAMIRPEAVHVGPRGAEPPMPNRIAGEVIESTAIGPSLRIRAAISGQTELEALIPREQANDAFAPGTPVWMTFAPQAVRIYREVEEELSQ